MIRLRHGMCQSIPTNVSNRLIDRFLCTVRVTVLLRRRGLVVCHCMSSSDYSTSYCSKKKTSDERLSLLIELANSRERFSAAVSTIKTVHRLSITSFSHACCRRDSSTAYHCPGPGLCSCSYRWSQTRTVCPVDNNVNKDKHQFSSPRSTPVAVVGCF